MPVNRLAVGSIPTRVDEIFIYIYIFFALMSRGKRGVEFNAMPPEIGGK